MLTRSVIVTSPTVVPSVSLVRGRTSRKTVGVPDMTVSTATSKDEAALLPSCSLREKPVFNASDGRSVPKQRTSSFMREAYAP